MRLLKAFVIGMGVLLILGFGGLVVAMVKVGGRLSSSPASTSAQAPLAGEGPYALDVQAPAGTHLEQVQTSGDRVLFRFIGAGGTRIVVVDPHSGKVTGTIAVTTPP